MFLLEKEKPVAYLGNASCYTLMKRMTKLFELVANFIRTHIFPLTS